MNDTTIEYYRKLSNDLQRKVSDLRAENEMLMVSIKRAEWLHDVAKASNGILQQEVEHIRAELARIKPSWDDAPEWAQWYARDSSRMQHWHESEPHPIASQEWISLSRSLLIRDYDWKKSKERRPEDK